MNLHSTGESIFQKFSYRITDDILNRFLCVLRYPLLFDVTQQEVVLNIKKLLEEPRSLSSEANHSIHQFLTYCNEPVPLVAFYCSLPKIQSALDAWSSFSGQSFEFFLKAIILPILSFKNWNQFWQFLRVNPDYRAKIQGQVSDLLSFLGQRRMWLTAHDVQLKLAMYEGALQSLLLCFVCADSWQMRRRLCEPLASVMRKLDEPTTLVCVQERIIDLFVHGGVPFREELEVMTSAEHAGTVGVKLLEMLQLELYIELLASRGIKGDEVMEHFVRQSGDSSTYTRWLVAVQHCQPDVYRNVMTSCLRCLSHRVTEMKAMKQIIRTAVKQELQGEVFLLFDMLTEAGEFAKKTRDEDLDKRVAYKKQKLGHA
jgi:hypothetical protein